MHIEVLIRWKLGQLSPGSTVQFRHISWDDSLHLLTSQKKWLDEIILLRTHWILLHLFDFNPQGSSQPPVLYRHTSSDNERNSGDLQITFRQVLMLFFMFCSKHFLTISNYPEGRWFSYTRGVWNNASRCICSCANPCIPKTRFGEADHRGQVSLSLHTFYHGGTNVILFCTQHNFEMNLVSLRPHDDQSI